METMNDLCRRLERAQASQRGRRRLPVRGWLHEFMERFVSEAAPPPMDGARRIDARETSEQTTARDRSTRGSFLIDAAGRHQ
jgi:hypothetical protein